MSKRPPRKRASDSATPSPQPAPEPLSEYLRGVPELSAEQLQQLDARRKVSAKDRRKISNRIGVITRAIRRSKDAYEAQHGPVKADEPTPP
jgi:hypothetical protein